MDHRPKNLQSIDDLLTNTSNRASSEAMATISPASGTMTPQAAAGSASQEFPLDHRNPQRDQRRASLPVSEQSTDDPHAHLTVPKPTKIGTSRRSAPFFDRHQQQYQQDLPSLPSSQQAINIDILDDPVRLSAGHLPQPSSTTAASGDPKQSTAATTTPRPADLIGDGVFNGDSLPLWRIVLLTFSWAVMPFLAVVSGLSLTMHLYSPCQTLALRLLTPPAFTYFVLVGALLANIFSLLYVLALTYLVVVGVWNGVQVYRLDKRHLGWSKRRRLWWIGKHAISTVLNRQLTHRVNWFQLGVVTVVVLDQILPYAICVSIPYLTTGASLVTTVRGCLSALGTAITASFYLTKAILFPRFRYVVNYPMVHPFALIRIILLIIIAITMGYFPVRDYALTHATIRDNPSLAQISILRYTTTVVNSTLGSSNYCAPCCVDAFKNSTDLLTLPPSQQQCPASGPNTCSYPIEAGRTLRDITLLKSPARRLSILHHVKVVDNYIAPPASFCSGAIGVSRDCIGSYCWRGYLDALQGGERSFNATVRLANAEGVTTLYLTVVNTIVEQCLAGAMAS